MSIRSLYFGEGRTKESNGNPNTRLNRSHCVQFEQVFPVHNSWTRESTSTVVGPSSSLSITFKGIACNSLAQYIMPGIPVRPFPALREVGVMCVFGDHYPGTG